MSALNEEEAVKEARKLKDEGSTLFAAGKKAKAADKNQRAIYLLATSNDTHIIKVFRLLTELLRDISGLQAGFTWLLASTGAWF